MIRIKNATLSRRRMVVLPYSKLVKKLAELLVKEGLLVTIKETEEEGKKRFLAEIARDKRISVFTDVQLISKPSLRVYKTCKEIEAKEKRGLGKLIVSTSKGLMTGKQAIAAKIGGQLLFQIW